MSEDVSLNVKVVTNASASAEELANYEALLSKLASDYSKASEGAKTFVGAQQATVQQAAQNAADYTKNIDETKDSLKDLTSTVQEVTIRIDGLRSTARALNQVGFSELGTVVQKAAALQQVFRQVSSIATQTLPELGAAAAELAPLLGADAAGFLAVAAPVLIIAGPLVAIGLAFKLVSDNLNANVKAAQDNVDAIDKDTNARIQNAIAARGLSAEQLKELKIQNDIAIQLKKNELDQLRAQKDQIDREYAGASNFIERNSIAARGLVVQDAIIKAMADLTDLGKVGENLYSAATENQVAANTKAAESKKQEASATKGAEKASSDYAKTVLKSIADFVTAGEKLRDENQKYAQTVAERVQADARAGATLALQQQIEADKEAEAAAEGAAKLLAIRQSETQLDLDEAEKRKEGIQKINDSFLQNSLKLWNNYYSTEQRDEAQYATQRLRKLQDLNTQLLDYVGTRDVAGFVNARAKGLTDISRGDEDESTAERQRREDYEKAAREAEQARQDQITQLEASLATETASKRAALQKQEQDQIAANNVKVKQSEIDAKKLNDLQAMWAKNDREAKRAIEDAAHNALVSKLQSDQNQLSGIIGGALTPAVSFFSQISIAVSNMIKNVQAAAAAPAPASYSGQFGTGQGFSASNTLDSRGLFSSGGAGNNITRTINASRSSSTQVNNISVSVAGVGDLVSTSALHEQTNEITKAVKAAFGVS